MCAYPHYRVVWRRPPAVGVGSRGRFHDRTARGSLRKCCPCWESVGMRARMSWLMGTFIFGETFKRGWCFINFFPQFYPRVTIDIHLGFSYKTLNFSNWNLRIYGNQLKTLLMSYSTYFTINPQKLNIPKYAFTKISLIVKFWNKILYSFVIGSKHLVTHA